MKIKLDARPLDLLMIWVTPLSPAKYDADGVLEPPRDADSCSLPVACLVDRHRHTPFSEKVNV